MPIISERSGWVRRNIMRHSRIRRPTCALIAAAFDCSHPPSRYVHSSPGYGSPSGPVLSSCTYVVVRIVLMQLSGKHLGRIPTLYRGSDDDGNCKRPDRAELSAGDRNRAPIARACERRSCTIGSEDRRNPRAQRGAAITIVSRYDDDEA